MEKYKPLDHFVSWKNNCQFNKSFVEEKKTKTLLEWNRNKTPY